MTVAEIAALLKLNQQTIRNWIDQRHPAGGPDRATRPRPDAPTWSSSSTTHREAPRRQRSDASALPRSHRRRSSR